MEQLGAKFQLPYIFQSSYILLCTVKLLTVKKAHVEHPLAYIKIVIVDRLIVLRVDWKMGQTFRKGEVWGRSRGIHFSNFKKTSYLSKYISIFRVGVLRVNVCA